MRLKGSLDSWGHCHVLQVCTRGADTQRHGALPPTSSPVFGHNNVVRGGEAGVGPEKGGGGGAGGELGDGGGSRVSQTARGWLGDVRGV